MTIEKFIFNLSLFILSFFWVYACFIVFFGLCGFYRFCVFIYIIVQLNLIQKSACILLAFMGSSHASRSRGCVAWDKLTLRASSAL
jgi:hypothetical protein